MNPATPSAPATPQNNAAALEELKQLFVGASLPKLDKLKEAYLALQEKRLFQLIGTPPPKVASNEYLPLQAQPEAKLTEAQLAELKKWFKEQPEFREGFLLALAPGVDDYPRAAQVALELRAKYPKQMTEMKNLVIAFAVVWDDPRPVIWEHSGCVPELLKTNPTPQPPVEYFGWYVTNAARMAPWFKTTPWRLQKYLAADCLPTSERDWVLKRYPQFNPLIGQDYSKIVYDFDKLKDGIGKKGNNPYTLENLIKFGGVCRDQAFYARSICRAFGMPAYMATGEANTGGGHGWVGWVVNEGTGYKLLSHGRYVYDKYFTAKIIEPQSGEFIHDYLVGIECKALSNEAGFNDAEVYYRVWQELGTNLDAGKRTDLLIAALQKNALHRPAWLAIGEATASGALPRASAEKQWAYLSANYKEFPDFTFSMATIFSSMYKTAQEKYAFYDAAGKVFKDLKRQDLVAKLLLDQIKMCQTENRKDLALQVALAGTTDCAGEGEHGATLAQIAANLSIELKQPQLGQKAIMASLRGMERVRAGLINPNWVTVNVALLETYRALGDTKGATNIQSEIDKARNEMATPKNNVK